MNSCFIFIRVDSLVLRFKKVKSMKRFISIKVLDIQMKNKIACVRRQKIIIRLFLN